MATKEDLKRLVDELPDDLVQPAAWYLEHLRDEDPFLLTLIEAPVGPPLTDEEREWVREGREDIRAGRTVSLEDLERELGR